ncbi:hypothetical protein GCM10010413_36910 [Promicromonospora sukumoe]|uniref:Helix-turn-helix protein n=1 Tax=Promicromonospora sukumoe TaxID=88382 RepID=A0A7W3J7D2_9MICO|nr:transcriptional regulator [Promicromonospora sukumoe]MBA8807631.1 hypothetical protein [Promicromonospora sukumoe]
MSDGQLRRMTGSEVWCAREALGLERSDLGRLLGNRAEIVRDWERGKLNVPFRVREQMDELEAITAKEVERLTADLRQMPQPVVVVYSDKEPQPPAVARFGVRWWRTVAARAAGNVPGTRIGTTSEIDSIGHES